MGKYDDPRDDPRDDPSDDPRDDPRDTSTSLNLQLLQATSR